MLMEFLKPDISARWKCSSSSPKGKGGLRASWIRCKCHTNLLLPVTPVLEHSEHRRTMTLQAQKHTHTVNVNRTTLTITAAGHKAMSTTDTGVQWGHLPPDTRAPLSSKAYVCGKVALQRLLIFLQFIEFSRSLLVIPGGLGANPPGA